MHLLAGCTSLVGQAICHALASAGANLALTDVSKQEGQLLCQEIQAKPENRGSLLFSSFDPRESERLTAFVKSVTRTMKRLDGLINCAMYSPEVCGIFEIWGKPTTECCVTGPSFSPHQAEHHDRDARSKLQGSLGSHASRSHALRISERCQDPASEGRIYNSVSSGITPSRAGS